MRIALLLLLAALLQACALQEERAYRIAPTRPGDEAKVKQVLREVAKQAGLPPSEPKSSFQFASHRAYNVWLRANVFPGYIDVYLYRSDLPPPHAFEKADRLLVPALSAAFGKRFGVKKQSPLEQVVVD